jgi:hypothetical protein
MVPEWLVVIIGVAFNHGWGLDAPLDLLALIRPDR